MRSACIMGIHGCNIPCTVFFAPMALMPPMVPTMKYWNSLLPVSLPPLLYFPKLGITVVSCAFLVPRWNGLVNSAWEVDASARPRFCTAAAEERSEGSCCRVLCRTREAAALEERDMSCGGGRAMWRGQWSLAAAEGSGGATVGGSKLECPELERFLPGHRFWASLIGCHSARCCLRQARRHVACLVGCLPGSD